MAAALPADHARASEPFDVIELETKDIVPGPGVAGGIARSGMGQGRGRGGTV